MLTMRRNREGINAIQNRMQSWAGNPSNIVTNRLPYYKYAFVITLFLYIFFCGALLINEWM